MVIVHSQSPEIPPPPSPPPPSLDRPASSSSGTSFKPLQLSSHPWVRSHLHPAPHDDRKPRLSFLALHYHMHGRESFSEPQEAASTSPPGRSARHRNSPEALSEALGTSGPSASSGSIWGGHAPTGASKPSGYFACKSTDVTTSTARDPPHVMSGRRGQSDVGPIGTSSSKPDTSRTMSAPEIVAPPLVLTYARPQDPVSHRRAKRFRPRGGASAPPLAITAFPTAFTGMITTSEGVFGRPGQVLNPVRQKTVTTNWLRQSRKRKHDAEKKTVIE